LWCIPSLDLLGAKGRLKVLYKVHNPPLILYINNEYYTFEFPREYFNTLRSNCGTIAELRILPTGVDPVGESSLPTLTPSISLPPALHCLPYPRPLPLLSLKGAGHFYILPCCRRVLVHFGGRKQTSCNGFRHKTNYPKLKLNLKFTAPN